MERQRAAVVAKEWVLNQRFSNSGNGAGALEQSVVKSICYSKDEGIKTLGSWKAERNQPFQLRE